MSAVELSRTEAVALVQRIMEADYVSEDEVNVWLDRLGRLDIALACPSGHVRGLVFWPPGVTRQWAGAPRPGRQLPRPTTPAR